MTKRSFQIMNILIQNLVRALEYAMESLKSCPGMTSPNHKSFKYVHGFFQLTYYPPQLYPISCQATQTWTQVPPA